MRARNPGDIGLYRKEGPYSSTDLAEGLIQALCEQVREAAHPLSCVILDDIPFDSWTIAEDLYNELKKHLQVALILVLSDVEALRKPLPAGKLLWNDFQTANLTAHQAISLVRHRISLFRPHSLDEYLAEVGLDVFPFAADDIARSVAPPNGDLDTPGSIPLRLLTQILDTVLGDMLDEFPPDDLTQLSPAHLQERLISLEQAYLREIGQAA